MTDNEIIQLGAEAGSLLDSHTFQHVTSTLRSEYMDKIVWSDFDAGEEREKYFRMIRAIDLIATELLARRIEAENTKHRLAAEEQAAQPDTDEGII